MKPSKYDSAMYWEHHCGVPGEIWANLFREEPIKPSTIISHVAIVNCFEESVERWIAFPGIDAFVGFLRYAFLPAAFTTWCTRDEGHGLVVSDISVENVIHFFEQSETCKYKDEIPTMWADVETLNRVTLLPEDEQFNALIEFAQEFKEHWNQRLDVFFYFDAFSSPEEVSNYLIKSYEEDEMVVDFEKELGVTKGEWEHVANHVFESEFMSRRFVDILNNRIESML